MLDRWKKAVLNIEASATPDRSERSSGTALLVGTFDQAYLLTAKHVVAVQASGHETLSTIIFRSISLPEALRITDPFSSSPAHLMNLAAGPPDMNRFTFCDHTDTAVLSLRKRPHGDDTFIEELQQVGYEPISECDLMDGPQHEGEDLLTVGFPAAVAEIDSLPLSSAAINWQSAKISLPVFSFGKVAMLSEALPYFWADMSIYPGNSGGPVIAGDRFVGIVSAQGTVPIDDGTGSPMSNLSARIPFARIVKGNYARRAIERQKAKDQQVWDLSRR